MIADIGTVLWKEFKELFHKQPAMRGGWFAIGIIIAIYGIFLPFQAGAAWVSNPAYQVLWLWLPFLMVSNVVSDTIAGERERHTLETLLASRLSDTAILLGKIISSVLYGWGIAIIGIIAGLITVNLTAGKGTLLMFAPDVAIGLLILTFLTALLASGLGVFVSLRASTVRQAQQTMSVVGLLPLLLVLILPILPLSVRTAVMHWLETTNPNVIALVIIGFLLFVDIILIAVALLRFQRSKLILD